MFGTEYDETQIERQERYFTSAIKCNYPTNVENQQSDFQSHLNRIYERQRMTVLDYYLEMIARQEGKAIASLETAEQRHEYYRKLDDKFQEKVRY